MRWSSTFMILALICTMGTGNAEECNLRGSDFIIEDVSEVAFTAECLGALGINRDVIASYPEAQSPMAVCCYGDQFSYCVLTTEEDCVGMGGEWHVEWDSCDPNPCGPLYACCFVPDECIMMTLAYCHDGGGFWYEGETCETFPCPPMAVCCTDGECEIKTWEQCYVFGGTWHEEWLSCEPNPCAPSPVGEANWGRLKAIYR